MELKFSGKMNYKTILRLASGIDTRDLSLYGLNYLQHAKPQNPRVWNPQSLSIEVTYWCNRRCKGCYVQDDVKRDKTTISESLLSSIIDQAIDAKVPFIGFAGGEPLAPASKDLVFRAIERHPKKPFFTYTNGDFVRANISEIAQHHNMSYMISLDGLEKNHNAVRGPGSFGKVVSGFDALTGARKIFGASITVRKQTYEEIGSEKFFEYLAEHGVKFARIRTLKASREEISDRVTQDMIKATQEYANKHCILLSWGGLENPEDKLPGRDLVIGMDGTIRAARLDFEESFGNLKNEELRQIFKRIKATA
jgi:MoaA/NifB/PqqE/SkfB family radical SAM enzyme